jgi:hypothetical protein
MRVRQEPHTKQGTAPGQDHCVVQAQRGPLWLWRILLFNRGGSLLDFRSAHSAAMASAYADDTENGSSPSRDRIVRRARFNDRLSSSASEL